MKPRRWTADEKFAIVLEGLKEKKSVAEICREHQISESLYYRWRDKFLEAGKKGLVNGASDDNVYKAKIEMESPRQTGHPSNLFSIILYSLGDLILSPLWG